MGLEKHTLQIIKLNKTFGDVRLCSQKTSLLPTYLCIRLTIGINIICPSVFHISYKLFIYVFSHLTHLL